MSKTKIKVGILAASSLQMASMGLVAIIPLLMAQFPQSSPTFVQSVFTIPTLMMVPVSLLVGATAAKTGKKLPLVIGIIGLIVFGLIPKFVNLSLPMLLVIMALIGCSLGTFGPTSTGLISDHFEGLERGDLIGKQSAFTNMGAMIMAFLGGLFVKNGWQNTYLLFLYAIPVLIIVMLCIPKDNIKAADDGSQAQNTKIKLSTEVYVMCALIFVFGICYAIISTNLALLVEQKGLGDPSTAGFITSVMSAIGIVAGLTYGMVVGRVKNNTLPLALALTAIGMVICSFAPSVVILYIGSLVAGVGFSLTIPTGIFRVSQSVDFASASFAFSLFLSSNGVAMFLSPVIINPIAKAIADDSAGSKFLIGGVVLIVLCVLSVFHVTKAAKSAAPATAAAE